MALTEDTLGGYEKRTAQVLDEAFDDTADTLRVASAPAALGTTSATVTQVASSATVVTLQAANTSRKELTISNDSTQVLYVKYGSSASATSYTWKVAAGGAVVIDKYSGIVTGIWASANGNAYVTEVA